MKDIESRWPGSAIRMPHLISVSLSFSLDIFLFSKCVTHKSTTSNSDGDLIYFLMHRDAEMNDSEMV